MNDFIISLSFGDIFNKYITDKYNIVVTVDFNKIAKKSLLILGIK